MEPEVKKGVTFALLSAVSGAYLFIFSKMALGMAENVLPETFCSAYYLFATVYFFLWLLLSGQLRLLRVSGKALKIILGIGLLEMLSVVALFRAIRIMDPTLVSFFNNAQTIFIILLSASFLKERFNRIEAVGTLVSLLGIFLISFRSEEPVLWGMVLTLLSAAFFSCTVVLIKKSLALVAPLSIAFYRALMLMALLNVYTLLSGHLMPLRGALLAATAAGAFFGPFLNILFYFQSLRHFDASKTSLIRASQPLFVMANAALFLRTVPSLKETAGGLVIIAGLYILVRGHERFARPGGTADPPHSNSLEKPASFR